MCFCTPPILLRSLLLWSGSDQSERARRRRWLGSWPIPVVVFHVSHVSSARLDSALQESKHTKVLGPGSRPRLMPRQFSGLTSKWACAGWSLLSWSPPSVQLLASHQGLWPFDLWSPVTWWRLEFLLQLTLLSFSPPVVTSKSRLRIDSTIENRDNESTPTF